MILKIRVNVKWRKRKANQELHHRKKDIFIKNILLRCSSLEMRISHPSSYGLPGEFFNSSVFTSYSYFFQLFQTARLPPTMWISHQGTNKLHTQFEKWESFWRDISLGEVKNREYILCGERKTQHYYYFSFFKWQRRCRKVKACLWVLRTAVYCIFTRPGLEQNWLTTFQLF